jgi:hypothetical protein
MNKVLQNNPYGTLCPHCGAPTVSRTRGIPSRDTCANNHHYLASEGVSGVNASGSVTADRIAYLIVTQPGGVDGLDANDKGGVVVDASFDKAAMEKRKGVDSRYRIDTKVVGDSDRRAALAKLSKLDRLLLDIK